MLFSDISPALVADFQAQMNVMTGQWSALSALLSAMGAKTSYAQGNLYTIGPFRVFLGTATTDASANSVATLNLTTDNTAGGPAIFSTIDFHFAQSVNPAASITAGVTTNFSAITGVKVLSYLNTVPNVLLLSLITYNPAKAAGSGLNTRFLVMGT